MGFPLLGSITPIILTCNEELNIERTLKKLFWAKEIVIVDSFSDDNTLSNTEKFSNIRIFQRLFDSHANQWNFALNSTNIKTEWVLALDADYVLTDELIQELKTLKTNFKTNGYQAEFTYCMLGKPLRNSMYPAITVLYRKNKAYYKQEGHTQKVVVEGIIEKLNAKIMHDDRKPICRWLVAQSHYSKMEVNKLLRISLKKLDWPDRIRKMRIVAPCSVLFYCLFVKGLILNGLPGIYYSFQRMLAELILSFYLIKNDLKILFNSKN